MKALNILLCAIILTYSGCKKDSNPVEPGNGGNTGKIQYGEIIDLITQPIGTAGGTVKVNKPGDKLDGMEIIIPPNSYSEPKIFEVSSAEIKAHQFGQYFNPISPMINISYDGGYAEDMIKVKVPVKVPKGHFAMGFFYDEVNGTLEGLPLLDLDSTSITLGTRHFSTSSLSSGGTLKSVFKGKDLTSFCKMLITSIDQTTLFGRAVIATGFDVKKDDWEFPNYGSYIAPRGHCAGQSISAMWYYYEKKLRGAPNLYRQFDNFENMWMDNPRGYHFASIIQSDMNFTGGFYKYLEQFELTPSYHIYSWYAFAFSMLLTGEPQFVGISRPGAGHALIAYKMSLTDNTLYVADPNFPGQVRTITYKDGKFQPYSSMENASQIDQTSFTAIGYFSKTSMIEWDKISSRWNEFQNGTIGKDNFPSYQLYLAFAGSVLKDGYYTDQDMIEVYSKSTQCLQCIPGTDHTQLLHVYNDKGRFIASGDTVSLGVATINLKLGLNKLGFYVMGARDNRGDRYVDFTWLNINKDTVAIEPAIIDGQPNKEYTFIARTFGTAPKPYKMVWNFGDNTPEVSINNDSTVKHTFTASKSFMITATMRNQANDVVGEGESFANITASPISIISTASNGEPILIPGAASKEYTFIAKSSGQAPKNGKAKFIWNFGDNSPAETIMNDSLVTHTFTKAGSFTINVKIYDDAKLIVEGIANVKINSSALIKITAASTDGAPISTSGTKNTEYTFIGRTKGTAPSSYKMTWSFGDNTSAVIVNNDSTVKHSYTSAGQFTINVKLYNQANVQLAEDFAVADIRSGDFYVKRLSPDYGPFGDTVYISGTGFGNSQGENKVIFKSEKMVPAFFWNDTLIKVTVPDGAISGNISLSIGGVTKTTSYFTSVGSLIDSVKKRETMFCFFTGYFNYSNGSSSLKSIGVDSYFPLSGISWQGNTFTVEKETSSGISKVTQKITGTLDDKGLILKSLKYDYTLVHYASETSTEIINKWDNGFIAKNIPWERSYSAVGQYKMELPADINNHISGVYDNYQGQYSNYTLSSIDWSNQYTNFRLRFEDE